MALVLVLCLLFSTPVEAEGLFSLVKDLFSNNSSQPSFIAYSDMEYTRPDLEQLQALLDEVCLRAQGTDTVSILDGVFEFYDG